MPTSVSTSLPVTKNQQQQQNTSRVKSQQSSPHQLDQEDQYHPSNLNVHQNNSTNNHQHHHKNQHQLAPVPSVCVRVPHSPRASVDSGASFAISTTTKAGVSPPNTNTPSRQLKTLGIDFATTTNACECHSKPTPKNRVEETSDSVYIHLPVCKL